MIDLRSDTVTRPGPGMRQAMFDAEVGDDVAGDDPTVTALEERVADLLGFEAAVFCPSGTQSNLMALLSHCGRGDEYIVGQNAHTYRYEGGGAAVLGGIQPQPLPLTRDGRFDLAEVEAHIKPVDDHFARTRLLCLENTHDGHVLPPDDVAAAQALARRRGLALHLDGARLWNAAVADGVTPAGVAAGFDSVSVCLSKGLGAPVGSVLAGSAELVTEARHWRKALGGGMRQSGVLAAAGLYALDHHVDRLADDHRRAARLATALAAIDGVDVTAHATNMVFIALDGPDPDAFAADLAANGVVIRPGATSRLVVHLDIDDTDVETAIDAVAKAAATT